MSPCLLNLHAEYIKLNVRVDETQAGIKIAERNINNLRYADDTTLTGESKEELKSLLMKVKKDSEKAGLKLNIKKTKIMASSPNSSWLMDGETVTDFIFFGCKMKRCLLLGRRAITNLDSILKSIDITLPTEVCLVKAGFSSGRVWM